MLENAISFRLCYLIQINLILFCLTTIWKWNFKQNVTWLNFQLNFQLVKCENLRISRKHQSIDREYHINGIGLNIVSMEKDLGILVSRDLKWNQHIKVITGKANKMLGFIRRSCVGLTSQKPINLLYVSLVRSHLSFCSQFWAPQSVIYNLVVLENIQRRATKVICGKNKLCYKDRLLTLNLLPINYWLEYLDLIFLFKCKIGDEQLFVLYRQSYKTFWYPKTAIMWNISI